MAKSGYIFGVILMVTLTFTSVNALLRCWRCTTDTSNSDFCKDPFEPGLQNDNNNYNNYNNYNYNSNNRNFMLENCSHPTNYLDFHMGSKVPACKKWVREVYGKTIISRSCVWVDISEPRDKCMYDDTETGNSRTKFCETCTTDGCNGSNGMIISIILIPAVIAKVLMM